MGGFCAADPLPDALADQAVCCGLRTTDQQGSAGLGIDEQFELAAGWRAIQFDRSTRPIRSDVEQLPGLSVGRRETAGVALIEQMQGAGVGGQSFKDELHTHIRRQHLSEVAQESKAGDVGAGMDAAAALEVVHQPMLAAVHCFDGTIDVRWIGMA